VKLEMMAAVINIPYRTVLHCCTVISTVLQKALKFSNRLFIRFALLKRDESESAESDIQNAICPCEHIVPERSPSHGDISRKEKGDNRRKSQHDGGKKR
jgi:hypothetical protein